MTAPSTLRDPWPWVGFAAGLAFIVLAILVTRRGGLAFDEPLAAVIQALPIPVGLWKLITALGGVLLIPIGVVLVLTLALTGHVRLALIVALTLIAAALFTELVKNYVARPRPTADALVPAPGYSFPSGHTLNSTATYGLLALVVWRSRWRVEVRRAVIVLGVTLPILVGISRVALGVHWPSDVLASWLAGIALVALAATLIRLTGAMERAVPRHAAETPAPEP